MDAMKDLRSFILIMVILAFVCFYRRAIAAVVKKRLVFKQAPAKRNPRSQKTNREITGKSYSAEKNSQSSLPKQSSSRLFSPSLFRGDDGPSPISSSSVLARYNNTINNSASIVYAAKSK